MMLFSAHSSRPAARRAIGSFCRGAWIVVALNGALGGCSMPIPSLLDPTPTGAIDRGSGAPETLFAPEDWRLARAALAKAIGAPASPTPSGWSNPETKLSGDFVAVDAPFRRGGDSCRKFVATVRGAAGPRSARGVGCLTASGDIALRETSDWKGL